MKLSKRIQNVSESATLVAAEKAHDLKAAGIDIISLTVGEADFPTPDYIDHAAIQSINDHTADHYTAVNGILPLRQAIINTYVKDSLNFYTSEHVYVGAGVKTVLFNLFQVLLDPGDEVILPVPYWVSYSEQIKMARGKPVYTKGPAENAFKLTRETLDAAYTDKTVAIIINSPSNPMGVTYNKEELEMIGEWAIANDVIIIADEIYKRLVYNGREVVSFADLSDGIKEQTIIVNGVSKAYAMTGWRIGYALGNRQVMEALTKYASQANGNPAAVSQYAAMAAYEKETDEVEEMIITFESRLNQAYDLIKDIPGFHLIEKPAGAFYLFPDVSEAAQMTGYASVEDFASALIEEAHVVGVPGKSFGLANHLRFSYAVNEAVFAEGMKRIKAFIESKL